MLKSRLSAGIYLLLVFCSGLLLGAFSHQLYTARSVGAAPPRPEEWRKKYVQDLRAKVKLDDQQVTQLQTILDETRQKFHQLKDQEKPLAAAIHNQQIERVRAMLRPDQVPLYDQFREEREKRRRDADKRQPPPQR